MTKLSTTLLLLLILLVAVSAVSAKVPSNVPCQCTNGASRDSSVTNHCACTGTCNAGFVLPFCNFASTARVNFAITYLNVSGFAIDAAQQAIQTRFGVDGNDVKWIQRVPRFETKANEIVVQYLITGQYVNQIYNDVWAAVPPAYLTVPYLALDMWQLGTVVAEAGVFARHYASGNVLYAAAVAASGISSSSSPVTLNIMDTQFEFLIGGLSVLLFCAIAEGILNCIIKPKETPEQEAEREALKNANNTQNSNEPQQMQPIYNNNQYNQQPVAGFYENNNNNNKYYAGEQTSSAPPPSGYASSGAAAVTEQKQHGRVPDESHHHHHSHGDTNQDPASVGLSPDWYFDTDTGYWWNEERQLYYDVDSESYGNPHDGSWVHYSELQ